LLARFAGLEFDEAVVAPDDPEVRAEMLLLASSIRVPSLQNGAVKVWDTLAIGEYLNELRPQAHLLPQDQVARAHCRAICGEMHSGFANLRSALPMNLRGHFPGFRIWGRAQSDIDRITGIWRECLARYDGPFLFGIQRSIADAMYAPVTTRFLTYDVKLDSACAAYCQTIVRMPEMIEWIEAAKQEPIGIEELEVEF
jgi:glutathione S-transferase